MTSPQPSSHSSTPLGYSTSLFTTINAEWTNLCVDALAGREVRTWADRHPAWSSARSVADIAELAAQDDYLSILHIIY